jgi:replicative DNA helicase
MGRNVNQERTKGVPLKGLPANVDAERYVLGCILLQGSRYAGIALMLDTNDFSLNKHRIIYTAMRKLFEAERPIDRITVADELMRSNELNACDGLSYLISLDEGLPVGEPNFEDYARTVKEKSMLRTAIGYAQIVTLQASMSDASSERVLSEATANFLALSTGRNLDSRRGTHTIKEIITEFPGGLASLSGVGMKAQGLPTGYTRWDDMTGGLQPGELIVIGGRPSMGKTALALSVTQNVAMSHLKAGTDIMNWVAIHSLEMSREALVTRLVCQIAKVNSYAYRAGILSKEERARVMDAVGTLNELPITINDDSGQRVTDIHLSARNLAAQKNLKLLIVDYLGLITPVKSMDNRNQEIGVMCRGLKDIAKELRIPVVVLAQLSRACEARSDKRPLLSDIRESGDVEQDADLVGFLYRESVYKPEREDLKGTAELLIRKQRNGPTGDIQLAYLASSTRFENRTSDME